MTQSVLITGGAGYIGSVLCRQALEAGYKVRVLDALKFGGESIVELFNNPSFSFVKGDVRDAEIVQKALEGIDAVVHLASIVGDPACAKDPEESRSVNVEGSKNLFKHAQESGVKRFIFASTCSNYGKMKDPNDFVHEGSPLSPVSLYAETKVEMEKWLLEQSEKVSCDVTCLRFSTVYGLSPRIRFDLTVNEFTKELAMKRELVIFGEQFWRPYCHVVDLSRSVLTVLGAPSELISGEVFNVGDTKENYQKQKIVSEIQRFIPTAKIRYVKKDEDPRDYRVSFEKIKKVLDFRITNRVEDGVKQILGTIDSGLIEDPDNQKYYNVL